MDEDSNEEQDEKIEDDMDNNYQGFAFLQKDIVCSLQNYRFSSQLSTQAG